MSRLRCAAVVLCVALGAANAQAQDRALDSVDTAGSESLDAADTGESEDLDQVDRGNTESLDAAEVAPPRNPSALPAPSPVPAIADPAALAEARDARQAVLIAQQRVAQSDAAYSEMMVRGYPKGDARAAIVSERDAAHTAYEHANTRYAGILAQSQ